MERTKVDLEVLERMADHSKRLPTSWVGNVKRLIARVRELESEDAEGLTASLVWTRNELEAKTTQLEHCSISCRLSDEQNIAMNEANIRYATQVEAWRDAAEAAQRARTLSQADGNAVRVANNAAHNRLKEARALETKAPANEPETTNQGESK
jgi:hypothetical protein